MTSSIPIADDYKISMVGQQIVNGQQDEVVLTAFGNYKRANNKAIVSYYEHDDNNPSVKKFVEIQIEPHKMIMTKTGGIAPSQLILEEGKRHLCYYATDFGSFMMGINTDSLNVKMQDEDMQASASYTIDVNSIIVSSNKLTLRLSRRKKGCKE